METWRKSARHYSTRPLMYVDSLGTSASPTHPKLTHIMRKMMMDDLLYRGGSLTSAVFKTVLAKIGSSTLHLIAQFVLGKQLLNSGFIPFLEYPIFNSKSNTTIFVDIFAVRGNTAALYEIKPYWDPVSRALEGAWQLKNYYLALKCAGEDKKWSIHYGGANIPYTFKEVLFTFPGGKVVMQMDKLDVRKAMEARKVVDPDAPTDGVYGYRTYIEYDDRRPDSEFKTYDAFISHALPYAQRYTFPKNSIYVEEVFKQELAKLENLNQQLKSVLATQVTGIVLVGTLVGGAFLVETGTAAGVVSVSAGSVLAAAEASTTIVDATKLIMIVLELAKK